MKQLSNEQRVAVIRCLVEGCSIRSTTRITGVSKNTIQKLTRDLGQKVLEIQDGLFRDLECRRVQCDEIWNFCYAKEKNLPDSMKGQPGLIERSSAAGGSLFRSHHGTMPNKEGTAPARRKDEDTGLGIAPGDEVLIASLKDAARSKSQHALGAVDFDYTLARATTKRNLTMPATKIPDEFGVAIEASTPLPDGTHLVRVSLPASGTVPAAEHARVCAQRDELVAVLANLADDYEAWMHNEYDGQTTTWQPTSVLIAARNALEKAKE
jgi:hypothetical protein